MKRRRMIQSILGVSAASALPQPLLPLQTELEERPNLTANAPDSIADGVTRFFYPAGLSAFRKLGEIRVPARQNLPGAIEAEAAEFLDFLISQSQPDRQSLYRDGAARLNQEARKRYGKPFAELSA